MLPRRRLQVVEILPQRVGVELGQELWLDREVVLPDIIDQLTFGHGGFTFAVIGGFSVDGTTRASAHTPRRNCGAPANMDRVRRDRNLKLILPAAN
jgi:hypothetical protein